MHLQEGHVGGRIGFAARVRRQGKLVMLTLAALAFSGASWSATSSVSYSYDKVGRVVTAVYDNGSCIIYSYDANGNRTAQNYPSGSGPQKWGTGVWGCMKWNQ